MLAWQITTEIFDEAQAVVLCLMGQVQVDHGGVDLLVPKQGLHGVQAGTAFHQMGRERMS